MTASPDEDVTLSCFDQKASVPKDCYRVKWVKYPLDHGSRQSDIFVWPKTPKVHDADRVKWEANEHGQMFLLLSKVQKSDEGLYSCEIWSGWECIHAKNISLKVKDCQSKVKKALPGSPITLDCSAGLNDSPQNLSWSLLRGGGNPVSLSSTERFERNAATLILRSVLVNDSGWYRCNYSIRHMQRCLDINLLVQGEVSSGESTTNAIPDNATVQTLQGESGKGFTTVHLVPLILGIAVIIALIGAVIYYKYNKKTGPPQTQGNQEFMEDIVAYEVIDDFSCSSANESSLQQQFEDGDMCTYK